MATPAIRVDGLGKLYRLAHGEDRAYYQTLRESLTRFVTNPFKKRGTVEEFWALNDVSFEVQPGEVVGIIGRNGAGKSTLLKILSRITKPTKGRVEINGRVGSLLEVGTGFHPELTGRENVFLNGSILGMSKAEIAKKFDEIVAFAEVEKFLDTPVKRYSSGMYVRLAFAVAAHLQPEILIVDEVLAVGDAGFQKKCLGKMDEVGRSGRTVLFVSHSMQAVSQLTNTVITLELGRTAFQGPTATGVARYMASALADRPNGKAYRSTPIPGRTHLTEATVITSDAEGEHICGMPIAFEFSINIGESLDGLCFSFQVLDENNRPVCHFWLLDRGPEFNKGSGEYKARCKIPRFRLYQGRYTISTYLSNKRSGESFETLTEIAAFEITMRGIAREEYEWQPGTMTYWEEFEWDSVLKKQIR